MSTKEIPNFEQWSFKTPRIKSIVKKVNSFTAELKAAANQEEAYRVYKKASRFSDKVNNDFTLVSVLYSIDTTNKKYEKAQNTLNEGGPLISAAQLEFTKALIASPYKSFLEKKLGAFLFQMIDYQLKSFSEKIVPDSIEENKLVMQYQTLIASAKISFRGGVYNIPQMGKFLEDPDRKTRKEASEAYYGFLATIKDQIEDIYDKLVHVRDGMAKKLGYKNYIELAYLRMGRYDYTPKMVAAYREQIREVVTPLAGRLARAQARRTGIKTPKIYDLAYHFKTGNPVPLGTTSQKIEHAKKMYDELSPETSYFFSFMVNHNLLDLEAKPGKQSGGYMTYFPKYKCPFIFSNFNGTSGDVDVLTHEFGHSFQSYCARNIKIPEYRSPTMEGCEIDSMSMEFFAEPWMGLFFDSPDKYRYEHLADSISFLPYGVTVDEFQHWVYEHPSASPAERDAEWHALEMKYTPYKVKAYKGCDYMEEGHRWLVQGHIFASPFYYIDYTLAQVLAFEFLNLNLKNHEKAWKKYVRLCKMGGKYPFLTLLAKDHLKNPFEEGVLKKTIRPLVKILKGYHAEQF
jgi:M3 family oligoendopeptidase